jgi:flagellar protein FlgJ
MADIFTGSLGGMTTMRSATSDANLIKGRASVEASRDKDFARKLREAQAARVGATAKPGEDKRLREVCRELEAVFLNMVLGKMRDTIPERALFPKSSGEKMMQSMLDIELTRAMAKGSGIGLGEMLYRQLSQPALTKLPGADR